MTPLFFFLLIWSNTKKCTFYVWSISDGPFSMFKQCLVMYFSFPSLALAFYSERYLSWLTLVHCLSPLILWRWPSQRLNTIYSVWSTPSATTLFSRWAYNQPECCYMMIMWFVCQGCHFSGFYSFWKRIFQPIFYSLKNTFCLCTRQIWYLSRLCTLFNLNIFF